MVQFIIGFLLGFVVGAMTLIIAAVILVHKEDEFEEMERRESR